MTDTDRWPFETDADRDDPLTAHRIAVTSSHPRWRYLVAFDRDSAVRPDEHETALLVSYLDHYKDYWYNPGYLAKLAERDLDVDGGANGVIFHKWADGDWGYRRQSFEMGPLFWPGHPSWDKRPEGAPFTLARLLDHMQTYGDDQPIRHWREWKAAHPEVFGTTADA